jgi:UPF0042 nucleotide-binding protein
MKGLNPALIFLEATHDTLVRRFSETRRPHPLAPGKSAAEGIRTERKRMSTIRAMADQVIDTSELTVHQLRQSFAGVSGVTRDEKTKLPVTLVSFGFKHGIPVDADLVFDVRFLPNPHFVPRLRLKTGKDREVVKFMGEHAATGQMLDRLADLLRFLVPQYVAEGKSYLTIAIGCTGGRHRSVMIAEALKKIIAGLPGARVRVVHRDIGQK